MQRPGSGYGYFARGFVRRCQAGGQKQQTFGAGPQYLFGSSPRAPGAGGSFEFADPDARLG